MEMLRIIKRFVECSVIKTLRFNITYFGWGGGVKPRVLIAKNIMLSSLNGSVVMSENANKVGTIKIGFSGVSIFDSKYQRGIWDNNGIITFGDNINLGAGFRISNHGKVNIGNNTTVSANSTFVCRKEINIGQDSIISWDVLIMDNDAHRIFYENSFEQDNKPEKIDIGDHVWVGCRSTVLKSTNIPRGCVVAAGSILSGKIDSCNVICGNNKKIIRKQIQWLK